MWECWRWRETRFFISLKPLVGRTGKLFLCRLRSRVCSATLGIFFRPTLSQMTWCRSPPWQWQFCGHAWRTGRRHTSKLHTVIESPDWSMSVELRWMGRKQEQQKEGEGGVRGRVSLQEAEHSSIYNVNKKKQNPFPLTASSSQTLTCKQLASGTWCEFNPLVLLVPSPQCLATGNVFCCSNMSTVGEILHVFWCRCTGKLNLFLHLPIFMREAVSWLQSKKWSL